ncbi:protrudin, partial [Rhinatrema bivittatum]|uniref:protrudin n=1 Tax=Rhinatrema bivittatum TaxID=194408 RepID=UPI00112BAEB8
MQATERDVTTMDGMTGQEGSPTMADPQMDPPPSSSKTQAFDLFNLVVSYKRLLLYLEPLTDAWEGIKYLLRWQMPMCSLLTCFTLNFLLLTLHKGAWFTVGALCIAVPALLGYLQEISQEHLSEPELTRRKYHSVRREDLQKVKLSRQEAVAEVKSFLIQLESVLSTMCSNCEAIYGLLYWKHPAASFQFYGAILGSICILYLLPFCWVLALLNSTLFLGTSEFLRVVGEYRTALQQKSSTQPIEAAPEALDIGGGAIVDCTSTPTPTSTEDLSPGSVEEAEEADPDEEFKDAIEEDDDVSQCPVEYDLGLQDNGFLSKNEVLRNKVSKLTEKLRKRYPANNFGTCNNCTCYLFSLEEAAELQQLRKQLLFQVLLLQSTKVFYGSHSTRCTERNCVCLCTLQSDFKQEGM